jgi:hypothetical protein
MNNGDRIEGEAGIEEGCLGPFSLLHSLPVDLILGYLEAVG